ncbi:putative PE family protein PE35 [Mycobacterium basiliense]|uniref:Putative PE family protein PE35 n=1 Tax=Mycobacterium basiliense TaxID=2094119 RepID=A0A3S4DQA8_9MYCO|nr:PE domain-containing protein [Mycobacterium basiliense]VDM86607.1 putative PE family protein PE35 [Mycobacterium basiliense]
MQSMSYDPAVAGLVASIVANAYRGLAAGTSASAAVTGLAPAGADEVSAQFASAFAAEGAQVLALNTSAQEELARAGEAFQQIANMYSAVDDNWSDALA